MQTSKKLLFTTLAVFFVIACLELIGFTILKLKDHDKGIDSTSIHRFSKYRHYELNPNYRGRKLRTGGQKTHSSDGFRRDSSISIKKPKDVIRIFYMGGSQLYGSNASTISGFPFHRDLLNSEGIDKISENLLNQKLKDSKTAFKVEVINAGVVSYQTFQHLFYVMEKIYRYSPDFIVFLDGHNDFYIADPDYNHLLDFEGAMEADLANKLNERSFIFATYVMARSLSRFSYFLSSVEKLLHQAIAFSWAETITKAARGQGPSDIPNNASKKSVTITPDNLDVHFPVYAHNTFIRSYKLIQQLGDHYGYKTLVFLQPEVVFENLSNLDKNDVLMREISIKQHETFKAIGARGGHNLKVRRTIRKMLPSLFQKYDIPYYDIAEIASQDEEKTPLYIDYTHLTPEGARRVGTKMAEQIFPHILLRLKSNPLKVSLDKATTAGPN